MSRLFWLVMGALGAGLILLLMNSETGQTLGMANDEFARTLYLGLWAAVLLPVILFNRSRLAGMLKALGAWTLIALVLMTGYEYRGDIQDAALRVRSAADTAAPVSSVDEDGGQTVTLRRSGFGNHFVARGEANGAPVRFLIDTGATTTTLTESDAVAAGVDPDELRYIVPVSTANGRTLAAQIYLRDLSVGEIRRTDVAALVARDQQLSVSLLGMNFLSSLHGLDFRQDRLILRD